MTSAELLVDGFGRIREDVHGAVEGLTEQQLTFRIDPETNTIAWLVWHLTRVQDDHVSDVAGTRQAWIEQGWVEKFGLPFDRGDTGYGHSAEQVGQVAVPAKLLLDYHDAVAERSIEYVRGLTDKDLPRVVDDAWDPPVTLAVRLVSVLDDCMQHAGQAALVRGVALRSAKK
jgi:uncharacterized damage-inducible protein DinB